MCKSEELDEDFVTAEVLNSLLDPESIRKNYSAIFDKSSDVYNDLQYWEAMAKLYQYLADLCDYKHKILEKIASWN